MTVYILECDCGFRSSPAGVGFDAVRRCYVAAVNVPGVDGLQRAEVPLESGESMDVFFRRLASSIHDVVTQQFSDAAEYSDQDNLDKVLTCPQCGEQQATFQFAGFS